MSHQIAHLIIGLGKGGAETMLFQILRNKKNTDLRYKVISFGASDYYSPYIKELGVDVVVVDIKKHPFSFWGRLCKEIADYDVICCWMYHANYIGQHIAKRFKSKKVIWLIRHSNLDPKLNSRFTILINKMCAKKSHRVTCIAYNGSVAKTVHESIGYDKTKGIVINNGCDCEYYHKIPTAKKEICKSLGINMESVIILSASKDTPIKDVPTFVKAFSLLHQQHNETIAIMCGMGIDKTNKRIIGLFEENGLILDKDFFLLGLRHDMNYLFSACDCYVLHSAGEAFPNTLVQAMACESLCVSTDVGDASTILANERMVVSPQDPIALSAAITNAIEINQSQRIILGRDNRQRVIANYSIQKIVDEYERLFECNCQ